MLKEIKYIQNIGRFALAKPVRNAIFGSCTLIFGENGWGKSTLADILRSLTTGNAAIYANALGDEQMKIPEKMWE